METIILPSPIAAALALSSAVTPAWQSASAIRQHVSLTSETTPAVTLASPIELEDTTA